MQQTYKFRLYPNKEQEHKLQNTLNNCRFVYNQLLEGLNNQPKPNRLELQNSIPQLKEKFTWLKDNYSKTLQYESYRLFSNLRALGQLKKNGKKVGKLMFKGENWFRTFTYNQSGFKIIETNTILDKLHLSKIGDIPIRLHRKIKGNIKQIVVKKYPSGKWYASVCAETDNPMPINYTPKKSVGLDMGIKHFLTDSEGHQIGNPHNLKKSLINSRKCNKIYLERKRAQAIVTKP